MRWKLAVALIVSMLPTLAFAHPRETGVHMRPQLFHDRAAKVHDRAPQARRHT